MVIETLVPDNGYLSSFFDFFYQKNLVKDILKKEENLSFKNVYIVNWICAWNEKILLHQPVIILAQDEYLCLVKPIFAKEGPTKTGYFVRKEDLTKKEITVEATLVEDTINLSFSESIKEHYAAAFYLKEFEWEEAYLGIIKKERLLQF